MAAPIAVRTAALSVSILKSLAVRLEQAGRPDRRLDHDIHYSLFEVGRHLDGIPPYTASLDATVALVDQVLPAADWFVTRTRSDELRYEAEVGPENGFVGEQACSCAGPASALLAALLKAKIGEAQERPVLSRVRLPRWLRLVLHPGGGREV